VGSTDYSGELSISDEILKRVVESYRRIRNTLRFLLANVSDFDPARHAVPLDRMVEADRYAIALAARLQEELAADYARYQFHLVAQKLQAFCSEDLGAFYLDLCKDRLYTCGADSHPRRSAQSALYHITHSLVRLMAPILSFTAEEAWRHFTAGGKSAADDSVFFHTWYALPAVGGAPELVAKWTRLRALRDPVRKQIEELRVAGKVGSSLQAEVELGASGEDRALLASLGEDLKYVFLTSAARIHEGETQVRASSHPKCERCWHYRPDVNGEGLCGRCQSNLKGPGETRKYA
jgi:isoleucyl-tRNA synthetase